MSKQGKRKITVELSKSKDLGNRPSVFERLGIKKASSGKKTTEHCRQWALHGSCAYGKSCKFAATHTLISPSKQRAANSSNKDNEQKRNVKDDAKRLHSTVVVRRTPDGEEWDQNDLEYADTDVLEKRRQELQQELELQLKMDTGKDMRKDKKKPVSSSSSSRSSSSSSASSSSSDGSSSSSSSGRNARRKARKGKSKRNSSSSSEGDVPSKRKFVKNDSKRDKADSKKSTTKKDDKQVKKQDLKKKVPAKISIGKKSLSPGKKSGGTPPITSKNVSKSNVRHGKSPPRKDRNKSASRERDRDRKQRDKDKDRDRRARSRTPKKGRSRSPRRVASTSKDNRKKDSSEHRSRPVSPKKPVRRDASSEKHKKKSPSRDRGRDNKDKATEKKKDKPDDKDKPDRKGSDRGRDRKDTKRDDSKRRGRDRGLGGRGGLEKPNKPMERLLPRPEERLAALAAITNRNLDNDKASTTSKDRQDTHSDRGRKQDRERDRSLKRDRMESIDREPGDYDMNRQYDHDREYDRRDDGDYDGPRQDDHGSPGYPMQGRDRHYDPGYDVQRPVRDREYPEDDERYREQMSEHREMGYDDRRQHRERSWEGRRSNSMDRERGFPHPRKEWEADEFRGGDWNRERHWPPHDQQMEWGDKEPGDNWHRRGRPGPHRGRMHDDYRGMRMEDRRRPRVETETSARAQETPPPVAAPLAIPEGDDKDVPDDLSEISDDPDDILNRDDMLDQHVKEESQPTEEVEDCPSKIEHAEKESTQDMSGACEEKYVQESKDDEEGLDFEEISDGELEEERARAGLGDALGVDWASLVADVHRREQAPPVGGARDRWKPERVLARIPLSVHMAGKEIVQNVLRKNAESLRAEQSKEPAIDCANSDQVKVNGVHKEGEDTDDPKAVPNVDALHPVAAIQVATEKRKKQRAILFGSGCEITRGLSARRDLALRRYLCRLPIAERTGHSRVTPQPSLFHAARALLMQAPVN